MRKIHLRVLSIVLVASCAATPSSNGLAGAIEKPELPTSTGTHEITVHSQALDELRVVRVRLPKDYDSSTRRFPVLFVLDAEWHFNLAAADVEFLSECSYLQPHPIPQMIVVGIVNVDRNRDFTPTRVEAVRNMSFPTSGEARKFRRFLLDEVLPTIDRTYRTAPYRVLAGWSLGGLFTVDTLLEDSSAFAAYLAISPSLWWDNQLTLKSLTAEKAVTKPVEAKELVITLGTAEQETMVANSTNEFVRIVGETPLENVTVELVPIDGLGHNYSPVMAFFMGMATVFADWNLPAEVLEKDLAALEAHYASMSARYHFAIPVPEDAFSKLGWKLFEAGRKDESGEVFRTWVERYPQSAVASASLGSYYREAGDRELAVAYLKKGLEFEEQSSSPRPEFIGGLRRDIDALSTEN